MSEILLVAAPLALGVTLATPKNYAPTIFTLAALGAGAGLLGLILAGDGEIDNALLADFAMVLFDLLTTAKILEII